MRSRIPSILYNIHICIVAVFFLLFSIASALAQEDSPKIEQGYLGSSKCRSCHENFYQLWAPSHHGLAMQPYTESFAQANLKPQLEETIIGKTRYRAVTDEGPGFVVESGPGYRKKHRMLHVLGGKNVYYFLTQLDRGHLQVLPVAYDVNEKKWYDTAASGVRHFPDRTDEPIHWTDRQYTFNTSCYGCHVSQLVKNYDLETDSYNTQWQEPGINCETCHGPAEEHVRLFTEAGEGKATEPKLKTITQSRGYSAHQVNSACLTCHTKGMPIAGEFDPGDSFFQYSDVVTLEHRDYYPDGRDLGENYTFTSWRMSACTKDGKMDCLYCHTSSGRYRFKDVSPNTACTSCHKDKKGKIISHSRHTEGATQCIDCHMPTTRFGGMMRSDHSMRPPMPSATDRFHSPNACNLCHEDKDAKWADEQVRNWHKKDYQKSTLEIAALIDEARKEEWDNLPKMLTYLQHPDKDEIFANSLVRLMRGHYDKRIGEVLLILLEDDASPLIRSSAADGLEQYLSQDTIPVLARATKDPYRLVRIRTVPSLASVPERLIPADLQGAAQKAAKEYITSMGSRPDDAMSHYNVGNYYAAKNKPQQAIESYETSIRLRDDMVLPYVNASLAYNRVGNNKTAVERLKQAILIDPKNDAAHLNLALLYGEMQQYEKAIEEFKTTFKLDPSSAVAAYNLCVLLAEKDADESIAWAKKATALQPENAKYAYTLGFYLYRAERTSEAIAVLEPFVGNKTTDVNIYMMLGEIYEQAGDMNAALRVYKAAAENQHLPEQVRSSFEMHLQQLTSQ